MLFLEVICRIASFSEFMKGFNCQDDILFFTSVLGEVKQITLFSDSLSLLRFYLEREVKEKHRFYCHVSESKINAVNGFNVSKHLKEKTLQSLVFISPTWKIALRCLFQ